MALLLGCGRNLPHSKLSSVPSSALAGSEFDPATGRAKLP
jgi:hypothetical protein